MNYTVNQNIFKLNGNKNIDVTIKLLIYFLNYVTE